MLAPARRTSSRASATAFSAASAACAAACEEADRAGSGPVICAGPVSFSSSCPFSVEGVVLAASPAKACVTFLTASVNSPGITQNVFPSPWARLGRVSRYL